MPQPKKKRTANSLAEKIPTSKAIDRDHKEKRTGLIITAVVITVILAILGVGYYLNYLAPFQRTIITVDNTAIKMDYFLKRTRLTDLDPIYMLQTLAEEQIVKLGALGYGLKVSPEEINQALRGIAGGESGNITESEFKAWYRQQLNEIDLSDSEYKEIVAASLLASRLQNYLAQRVPTVAKQVHLHGILLKTLEDAKKIRARWEAGEDFASLAREASLDEETKEGGGDLGWLPRGVLDPQFDSVAFNLSPGEVSQPISTEPLPTETEDENYLLLMVSEKTDARQIDENSLQQLKDKALELWLSEEVQFHEIKYHGFHNGFDSETNAWINWQLTKK